MNKNFEELINKSKELSKKKILEFATGIFDIDEGVFDHLWSVPIISIYQSNSLIKTTLSTKDKNEIADILNESIESEFGDSSTEAVFIPFDKLALEFENDEVNEYIEKLNLGEITEDFNAFIVYDEEILKSELENIFSLPKTQEEIEAHFVEYVAKIFTHERCHLNVNTLQMTFKEFDPSEEVNYDLFYKERLIETNRKDIENGAPKPEGYSLPEEINGALETCPDTGESHYMNENEVLLETFSDMIFAYEKGDQIEDCLQKVLNDNNLFTGIPQNTVKKVRIAMALYPNEIANWVMFGAYDDIRTNVLSDKIVSIFGDEHEKLVNAEIIKLVQEHCSSMQNPLSPKQIEMLKTLGITKLPSLITQQDIRDVATSKEAMIQLEQSALDIKSVIQEQSKDDTKTID